MGRLGDGMRRLLTAPLRALVPKSGWQRWLLIALPIVLLLWFLEPAVNVLLKLFELLQRLLQPLLETVFGRILLRTFEISAVDSAMPSMTPTASTLTPSVPTRNSGSRLWIISDETSINRLTKPSTQMPVGMRVVSGGRGLMWVAVSHRARGRRPLGVRRTSSREIVRSPARSAIPPSRHRLHSWRPDR